MIYLSKPNAGFSLLTSQLFSGRVIKKPGSGSGGRISNSQPSAIPAR